MNTVAEQEVKSTQPEQAEAGREYATPDVNILETADAYVLEAEMPGVNKEGLNVSVEDNFLTLVGRRQAPPQASVLYRESGPGDYRRVFELDPAIEAGKITATIVQGILTVTLPKAEKARARQITIN